MTDNPPTENDMSKAELIDRIYADGGNGRSKKEIGEVLGLLAKAVAEALAKGESVEIPGLVRLKMVDRAPRTGRNPQTGEALEIPAKRVAKATVLHSLAKAV